jgi:glycosyltransferase involved in cell wall biosynthesis
MKNVHVLLRILRSLIDRGVNAELRLVGAEDEAGYPEVGLSNAGYVGELRSICRELEINDRVDFIGAKSAEEMVGMYAGESLQVNG